MQNLMSSFQLQTGHTQKNRTVLAPMTNSQSHDDGTLSDAELHWLALRAEGGFGMIISAASHVQPNAKAWLVRWAASRTPTSTVFRNWPRSGRKTMH